MFPLILLAVVIGAAAAAGGGKKKRKGAPTFPTPAPLPPPIEPTRPTPPPTQPSPPTQIPKPSSPPPPPMDWEPDWEEVAYSDQLFVAPDCSVAYHGNFWSSNRLTPLVQEAARAGNGVFAEDILNQLLIEDAPIVRSPITETSGQATVSPLSYKRYLQSSGRSSADIAWTKQVYDDLELYTQFPELLP